MEEFIMFRTSWFPWHSHRTRNGWPRHLSSSRVGRSRSPLVLEQLEDRTALSNFNAATVSHLIADINAANKAGGTNTITLAQKTTFTLTQMDNNTDGGNGLPVIAANDNLTIVGNIDTIQRRSNSDAFRLFDVASGASLTLINLTLQNGLTSNAPNISNANAGGGILNNGTLSVSGCTLSGNSADGAGGGICNVGSLTLSGCTLSQNSAGQGGAIWNDGTATVQTSTLSHNSAAGAGGGIYNAPYGTLTVSASTVSKNSAGLGGGIYQTGYPVTINDQSVVCGNTAGTGDDVFVAAGGLTISSDSTVCIIYYNTP
jgi:hypothetical protein